MEIPAGGGLSDANRFQRSSCLARDKIANHIDLKARRNFRGRNRVVGSILMVSVVLVAAPIILAQTGAQPGAGTTPAAASKPDLSGVWTWAAGKGEGGRNRFSMMEPPLQPWAVEKYKANRAGTKDPEEPGLEKTDPSTYCFPSGVPRNMMGSLYPFEIVQNPKQNSNRVLILVEADNMVRQIWMDGREHPKGWPFGWLGHSTGKWEGDTLVVDTVCRNGKTWVEIGGTPNSDALHIVERMRLIDSDTLEIEFLFEDPKAFTKPWGAKRLYRRRTDLELAENIACEAHLKMGTYREARWPPEEGQEEGK